LRERDRRVADAARQLADAEVLVNVQGDEPEISPTSIDAVIELLAPIRPRHGDARHADPAPGSTEQPGLRQSDLGWQRSGPVFQPQPNTIYPRCAAPWGDPDKPFNQPPIFFQHFGLYAYRRAELLRFATLARLRWSGPRCSSSCGSCNRAARLWLTPSSNASSGIDTPADYAAFVARLRKAG